MFLKNTYKYKDKNKIYFTCIKKESTSILHGRKIQHVTRLEMINPQFTIVNKGIINPIQGGISCIANESENFDFYLMCSTSHVNEKMEKKPQKYLKGQFKTFFLIDKTFDIENLMTYLKPFINVNIHSVSKGKGTLGVMQRYGFKGMPASHGVSLTHRHAGSTGRDVPRKLYPGVEAPGKTGFKNRMVKSRIFNITSQVTDNNNVINIWVFSSVPGNINTKVAIGVTI